MRLSIRWLNQYLHTDLAIDALIETMTMAGLEVEDVLDLGMRSGKIVVARVLESGPLPGSDHLSLCKVDAGQGEPLSIVCGAPNVQSGMTVACALVGAALPGGLSIERRRIRGQWSEGMLCSPRELGMGTDQSGIMELPEGGKVGEPFDCIVEIKVTPNRPDCLSVLGVARDVGAMLGKKVFPPTPRFKEMLDHIEGYVRLFIKARNECPRYACRLMRGVRIVESPTWLKRALESAGMRPINNVVDVTNYVLHELGHPLHAFDFEKLAGGEIQVRLAQPDEPLKLIDGRELKLCDRDLVIADAQRVVALAGVMGGFDSEVTDRTTHVLLEAAYFDPATIRRTARRYNLQTEASYRFERGTDRARLVTALGRATQLIQEISGGEVAKGYLDLQATTIESSPIVLETGRVNDLLGLALSSTEIADYLVNLGFEIRRSDRDSMVVVVPSHRVDVARDVDLIEEIARLYGYNRIPSTMPRIIPSAATPDALARLADEARGTMASLGYDEAMSYSFIGEAAARATGADPARQPRLANPLTIDQALLRASLLPGLLEAVARNQKQAERSIQLFEVGKFWGPDSRIGEAASEGWELAAVTAGTAPPHWAARERPRDFFDLKGTIAALLGRWSANELRTTPLEDSTLLHPRRALRLEWEGEPVGELGELHPDVAEAFDLKGRVYAARLDLRVVAGAVARHPRRFHAIARFPASERDLAIVVDRAVATGAVIDGAREAGGALVERVDLFDLYEGDKIEAGKKSLALRFRLRSAEKTLTDEEIGATLEGIRKALENQFGALQRA
jgi:phenylalanyl-tRNA synthetase beta chain